MKKLPGKGEAREAVLLYHKVTRGQAGTNQCSWGVMREMTAEEQLCQSTVNGKVRVHRECMESIHSHVSLGRLGAGTGVNQYLLHTWRVDARPVLVGAMQLPRWWCGCSCHDAIVHFGPCPLPKYLPRFTGTLPRHWHGKLATWRFNLGTGY